LRETVKTFKTVSQGILKKDRKKEKSQKKPEVSNEVRNLCSVVTETFEVLSLFGVTHCYS
jgi:protein-arginine kinase activator protein McsA